MKRTLILLAVALATSPPRPAAAAPAPEGSPEAVIAKAIDAMNHGRTAEFVQAVHPDSLKELRTSILDILALAVAKGQTDEILAVFHGIESPDELRKLDGPAMFNAMISKVTSALEARRVLESMKVEVVGSLPDGEDRTYVVYRTQLKLDDLEIARLETTAFRKSGTDWKMTLDNVAAEMAVLKGSLSDVPKAPDLAATKFEPLGHIMDGKDAVMVVYRMVTPMGDGSMTKLNVLRTTPEDPEWSGVLKDEKGPTQELLKRKVFIPQGPTAR